jgi:copper chaperone
MSDTVKIKGMSCNHCVMAVTKTLNGIQGVTNVNVDLAKGEATFDREESVDRKLVEQSIVKAGYEIG